MSKIALQANNNGTGTFTVVSPDSNTNRTLTLPDLSGSAVVNEGTGIFKIDSTGNVGIGTATPTAELEVSLLSSPGSSAFFGGADTLKLFAPPGSAWAEPAIKFQEAGSDVGAVIAGKNTGNGAMAIVFANRPETSTTSALTERMRIDTNGTVTVSGQLTRLFTDVGLNTLAQNLATTHVSQVTVSTAVTLTTTVPPAGTTARVIVVTSGVTTNVVTFGTGFASTGTLATGTVAGRRFVITFISDGTRLLETSRTLAITV